MTAPPRSACSTASIPGGEAFERELPEWDLSPPRQFGPAARRPVRGHGHDAESAVDEVAEVGTLPGDDNTKFQLITTRSPPVCATTSPTTCALRGTSSRSTTRIIPSPMLNVPNI